MSQVNKEPKLKQVRNGHRIAARKLMSSARDAIDSNIEGEDDRAKLRHLKNTISEKRLTLSQLDEKILYTLDDEDIEEEICQCDSLQGDMSFIIVRLEHCLEMLNLNVNRQSNTSAEQDLEDRKRKQRNNAKLPKLELEKFYGDYANWISFWDSFESTVHQNDNISDVDKFNYLKSLLGGVASDAVAGLSLSANNYREAIMILQKRFGNKQVIINRHMEELLKLPCVSSSQNLKEIRLFCDKVENNIRSLNSLGMSPLSYGSVLAPMISGKLPNELRLIISREIKKIIGTANLCFDELLTIVAEVENILNSRPLTYLSSHETEEALTPAHLLYGRPILKISSDMKCDNTNSEIRSETMCEISRRHKHLNILVNHFWNRWKSEYLVELRNAHRKTFKADKLKIEKGEIVIVHDENTKRNFWKLGKVEELIISKDKLIRAALVKVTSRNGSCILRRPIQLLYPLELKDDDQPRDNYVSEANDVNEPIHDSVDDMSINESVTNKPDIPVRSRRAAAISSDVKRKQWLNI